MKKFTNINIPNFGNNHISIFSGAGGLDIGLHKAGWNTVVAIEKDPDCLATLNTNKCDLQGGKNPFFTFDDVNNFTNENLQEIKQTLNNVHMSDPTKEINLVSGGTPCQPFSTAGKREGLNDPRGQLFFKFANIIEMVRPRFFILENVRGLTSASLPNDEPGSVLKKVIYPTFQKMGYELAAGLLDARNYGVAQSRTRFILIGSYEHDFGCWPNIMPIEELVPPTTEEQTGSNEWLTLKDVISEEHLRYKSNDEYLSYSSARADVYKQVPPGQNWRYFQDEEYTKAIMGGAYKSTGGRVGFWRRLSWDKWSPTLTTSPIQKATGFCHPDEVRPLTVQEYQLIQGFSKFYVFQGNTASKYRQIGNAVPVQLGESIGLALLKIVG